MHSPDYNLEIYSGKKKKNNNFVIPVGRFWGVKRAQSGNKSQMEGDADGSTKTKSVFNLRV